MAHSAATAAPPQRVLLRFAPAVLIIFFGYLAIGMPLAVLPLQVHDRLGFGSFVVGVSVSLQSLATLASRQLAGSLCDRRGPNLAMRLGGACSLAAGLIQVVACVVPASAAVALAAILAARVVLGIGESLLVTGSLAWAIGLVDPRHTGKVMVWVGIGMYGALAAGAPLGIWLVTGRALADGFVTVAITASVWALAATVTSVLVVPVAPAGGERLPFRAVAVRIAPFGAGLTLASVGFGAIAAFAALDFRMKGWPGAGFALATFGVTYIVTRILLGHWPDRFGGARVAMVSLIVEAGGQILLWLAPFPAVAIAGSILSSAGVSLVFPSFGIVAMKLVPPASRGSALGAYVAFADLGYALAGPLTGVFAGAFGYPSVFAAGALSAAMAVLPALYAANSRNIASQG